MQVLLGTSVLSKSIEQLKYEIYGADIDNRTKKDAVVRMLL